MPRFGDLKERRCLERSVAMIFASLIVGAVGFARPVRLDRGFSLRQRCGLRVRGLALGTPRFSVGTTLTSLPDPRRSNEIEVVLNAGHLLVDLEILFAPQLALDPVALLAVWLAAQCRGWRYGPADWCAAAGSSRSPSVRITTTAPSMTLSSCGPCPAPSLMDPVLRSRGG